MGFASNTLCRFGEVGGLEPLGLPLMRRREPGDHQQGIGRWVGIEQLEVALHLLDGWLRCAHGCPSPRTSAYMLAEASAMADGSGPTSLRTTTYASGAALGGRAVMACWRPCWR